LIAGLASEPALPLEQGFFNRALTLLRMLSPQTQTNLKNAKSYFEKHLAVGDYYAEAGHVVGEWIGQGARMLGFDGAVAQADFVALCENNHPQTGGRLTQRLKSTRTIDGGTDDQREVANRRVFYDFTFSPPKSVSIAALVSGDSRIVEAHREAVKVAVGELEAFAMTRVRHAGQNSDRSTGNFVAALFEHETSRALDPHLHTHCIIFNATHDAHDARWKALQNYQMLAAQKFVENVYYHELARALCAFGYTIENSARGDFRVAEISPDLTQRFSKRHYQINEQTQRFLAEHPEKSSGNINDVRERLAHRLRSRKMDDLPPDQLRGLWQSQLTPEDHSSLRVPSAPAEQKAITEETAVSWAEEHLFERRSVIRDHELWRYALEFARGSTLTLADLKRETASRDYLREPSGELTRRDVLAREWRVVQIAKQGAGRYGPVASGASESTQQLADDQQHAFDYILASRDFVTLFRGGAGTGKSYVLRSVQEAISYDGRETMVLAPQRQQVLDLQRDGLHHTQTVAEFLQKQVMRPGAVVVVDEAGQIGGRQMLALLESVAAHQGRIILSGDTRQHGPVQASDALRAIERYSGLRAAELNAIRRQDPQRAATQRERARIAAYREAVKAAAEGNVADSFALLEEIDAVIETSPAEMRDRIVRAYLDLSSRGESALVVSQTCSAVSELNESIREALRSSGSIEQQERSISALNAVDLTNAQKLDARYYPSDHVLVFNRKLGRTARGATGRMLGVSRGGIIVETQGKIRLVRARNADHITVCTPQALSLSQKDRLQLKANGKAERGEVLANGEVVTIKNIRASGEIELTDGRTLPADYRQFARGYAVTSYGSQGKTVDHVLLGDAANRGATNAQQWYVSISRGRRSVRIFTADTEQLRANVVRSGDRTLALTLKTPRNRHQAWRQILLHGKRRGRAFARAVCMAFAPKRRRATQSIKSSIAP
jgi:conjugative relaxase-like TrwC/TraI family protein